MSIHHPTIINGTLAWLEWTKIALWKYQPEKTLKSHLQYSSHACDFDPCYISQVARVGPLRFPWLISMGNWVHFRPNHNLPNFYCLRFRPMINVYEFGMVRVYLIVQNRIWFCSQWVDKPWRPAFYRPTAAQNQPSLYKWFIPTIIPIVLQCDEWCRIPSN